MKHFFIAFLLVGAGLTGGYIVYPLVNPAPLSSTQQTSFANAQTASCELDERQVKDLVERIAPSVAEYLVVSSLVVSDADPAIQYQATADETRKEKETAFLQAQDLVDRMIFNRSVTPAELGQAMQLLNQTGQEDKAYLLQAQIAVAVNNGELTPQQAGYTGQPE